MVIWAPCGSLWLWGEGRLVGGASGGIGVSLDTYTHVHARTCIKREDKHVRKLQMAATMEAAMFIMFNMHACVCTRVYACMHVRARAHMRGGCPQNQ